MKRADGRGLTRRQFGLGSLALAGAVAAPGAATAVAQERTRRPAEVWAELVSGNRRFMQDVPRPRALAVRRKQLEAKQEPRVVIFGCSDSRVSPTLVFGQSLGDLFIVSIAGTIADAFAVASMEYAVDHFPVKVLVVLGHEKCGAVEAAASGGTLPTANLEELAKKIEPALTPLRGRASGAELVRLGIEANVHHSAHDILEQSPLIRQATDSGRVLLVKALYRLGSGEVVRLG